ncbi:MAG: hypothetical protein JXQ67_02970 [Campylobacterales bacterium]|nr:hypothetical protein [Campylobacterales bacterium]
MSKVYAVFLSTFILLGFLSTQFFYLSSINQMKQEEMIKSKRSFNTYVGMSGFVSSESGNSRLDALDSVFDIYPLDATLREYEKKSFIISIPSIHL